MEQKNKLKRAKIIKNTLLIIAAIFFTGTIYIKRNYNLAGYEQIILSLQTGLEGTGLTVIKDIVFKNMIIYPGILFLLMFPYIILAKIIKFNLKENESDKDELNKKMYKLNKNYIYVAIIFLFISIYVTLSALQFNKQFLETTLGKETKIYDEKYVNPNRLEIELSGKNKKGKEKKEQKDKEQNNNNENENKNNEENKESKEEKEPKQKNLIFIVAESLESSAFTKDSGGKSDIEIMPELEKIAKENINFSWTDKLGGFKMIPGATLTTGALATFNTGVSPMINFGEFYKKPTEYMPGALGIGEILKRDGYNNSFILGSDANYGARRLFFETHGIDEIVDLHESINRGYLPEGYNDNFWGFEDHHLFRIAKEEITKKSKEDKPFFTTILTVDTHFPDGNLPKDYRRQYEDKYIDVYRNQSRMIGEFVDWVKNQDFYKDTVIVIVGDHLTMKAGYFGSTDTRYVFNTIINSEKQKMENLEKYTKNRKFVTSDLTPTILSAIGYNIDGDRYGMGTNLFSDKKTYTEEIGYDAYVNELGKFSSYYNIHINKKTDKNDINQVKIDDDKFDDKINNVFEKKDQETIFNEDLK